MTKHIDRAHGEARALSHEHGAACRHRQGRGACTRQARVSACRGTFMAYDSYVVRARR